VSGSLAARPDAGQETFVVGPPLGEPCKAVFDNAIKQEAVFLQFEGKTPSPNAPPPRWAHCQPVWVTALWDMHLQQRYADVRSTVRQQLDGYLYLKYDRERNRDLEAFFLDAPYNPEARTVENLKGSAAVRVWQSWYANPRTVTTSDLKDFVTWTQFSEVHFYWDKEGPETSGTAVACQGGPSREAIPERWIWPSEGLRLRYETKMAPDDAISVEELMEGLKSGQLVKHYHVQDVTQPILNIPGSADETDATITISFKPPGGLVVAPSDGFSSSGPDSTGKFTPSSKTYTLKNSGDAPLDFRLAKTAPWLALTKSSGTLPPGQSDQVTVSLDESVRSLKEGQYKDQVQFTNATNGHGNTTRAVALDVSETQVWTVKLAGQELADMGGTLMYIKMPNNGWRNVTVDWGVRFGHTMAAQFTIKKHEGVWEYAGGQIVSGNVGYGDNFDPNVFTVIKVRCVNCDDVSRLAGTSLAGEVDGNTVRLVWPKVVPEAVVTSSIRLQYKTDQKSQQGYSYNRFESGDFFVHTGEHYLPLQNGEKEFQITKTSSLDKFRLDKRKPISISYRYLLNRIR
jgi:hypothetical protein